MWADPSGSLTINFFFAPAYNRLARILVVRPILVSATEPVAWDLMLRPIHVVGDVTIVVYRGPLIRLVWPFGSTDEVLLAQSSHR